MGEIISTKLDLPVCPLLDSFSVKVTLFGVSALVSACLAVWQLELDSLNVLEVSSQFFLGEQDSMMLWRLSWAFSLRRLRVMDCSRANFFFLFKKSKRVSPALMSSLLDFRWLPSIWAFNEFQSTTDLQTAIVLINIRSQIIFHPSNFQKLPAATEPAWTPILASHNYILNIITLMLATRVFSSFLRASRLVQNVQCRFHTDGDTLPRQHSFYWTKQQKKLLYGKKIKFDLTEQFHDVLKLPSQDPGVISTLFDEIQVRDVPISPENVCMLIHQFIEYDLLSAPVFDILEKHAYRHKGEYQLRSVFGGLRGAIMFNRTKLVDFFLQEYYSHEQKLTVYEMLQLVEAVNSNRFWSLSEKQQFWETHLRADLTDGVKALVSTQIKLMVRLVEAVMQLEDYNDQLWEAIIAAMADKKGWGRIPILEKLYLLSGTFESAKALFDKYFEELSSEDKILRRYNLSELRYYTPLEIIKIAEDNPSDYWPKQRSIVPEGEDPEEWNQLYEEFLLSGSVKQEAEIIKDKSMSFGYAIKDRYESMQADNVDMSSLSTQQFDELFGSYDEAMKVLKDQEQEAEQVEGEQGEQGEQVDEGEEKEE